MKILASAVLATLLSGAFVPVAEAAQEQQCLRQNMVNGWKVIDNQTLIVSDRVGRQYTVRLEKGCTDLKWPMHLGFSAGTGFGLSCITRHSFLTVPDTGVTPSQRCQISSVTGPGNNG